MLSQDALVYDKGFARQFTIPMDNCSRHRTCRERERERERQCILCMEINVKIMDKKLNLKGDT